MGTYHEAIDDLTMGEQADHPAAKRREERIARTWPVDIPRHSEVSTAND